MSNKQHQLRFVQATLFAYKQPFKRTMLFKQYSLNFREGLIFCLTDNSGIQRFLEIAPLPGFSIETLSEVKQELLAQLSVPLHSLGNYKSRYASIQFAFNSLHYNFSEANSRQATIDNIALLEGDKTSLTAQYKTLNKPNIIKLKVARGDIKTDIANYQHLCQLNAQLKIRCDANQAWSEQQAKQFFSAINVEQLDYIEEPTNNHGINLQLAETYQIAIALDETLQQPSFNYQHHTSIKAFIIKPTIIGGKEKIDQLVSQAKQQGIKVSFSSSFESIIGLQMLQSLANHYHQENPQLAISLGIDTLKYFNSKLLMKVANINQDCQQLEVLWSSR